MADSGIRTHCFWLSNRGDAHTFVLIKVLRALEKSLRVMGNFRTKKTMLTTELNSSFSKELFGGK